VQGAVAAQNSRLVGSAQLQQAIAAAELVDVWRCLHPGVRGFTRHTSSVQGPSAGRTTMWLVDARLEAAGWPVACQHMPGHLPGDHYAVTLDLTPAEEPYWGTGHWVLPLYLLSVPEYVDSAKQRILEVIATAPQGQSAAATWEDIKGAVQHHATAYGYKHAAARRQHRQELQRGVARTQAVSASMPHDGAAALAARQAVHQLQGYDEQQGEEEGRALGALWAEYGEQGTLWFHRLGKQQPEKFPFMQVKAGGQGPAISLMTQQGAGQAGSVLADYFDGDIPTGFFFFYIVFTRYG
jgi:hypothetical protein